jgi:hypothetical protein
LEITTKNEALLVVYSVVAVITTLTVLSKVSKYFSMMESAGLYSSENHVWSTMPLTVVYVAE